MEIWADGQHPFLYIRGPNHRIVKKMIPCLCGHSFSINELITFQPRLDKAIPRKQINQAFLFSKNSNIGEGKSLVAKFIKNNLNKSLSKPCPMSVYFQSADFQARARYMRNNIRNRFIFSF
ncbi:MAG: hypothetical protein DBY37_07175 [Desulfovibrionaceae bacterium]|nr:MAG: hypothetical protein DBY37_07175 [Desulfovibrionaceae bacterium]